MKKVLSLLLALCLLCSALPASAALTPEKQAEADAIFARFFARKNTVGGAVIVNHGGERLYAYFHGKAAGGRPVTEDTVFKIASVTKMITAIGVMQLVEEGKLCGMFSLSDLARTEDGVMDAADALSDISQNISSR